MHKQCNNCKETKLLEAFYPKTGNRGPGIANYSSQCRECDKEARKIYVLNNPDKCKDSDRGYHLSRYGISVSDYNSMFIKQNGCCLGCGTHQMDLKKRLCVDHCHKTDIVRGLLCQPCNSLLGMAKDNVETLSNLIKYLTNFSELAAQSNVVAFKPLTKVG